MKDTLQAPAIFDLYQGLVGENAAKRDFVRNRVRPFSGMRALDIGCGTGGIVSFLPDDCQVVGIDISEAYINVARLRFGSRAKFILGDASDPAINLGEQFDVAYAYGVFHHIPDDALTSLLEGVTARLKPGGRIVAADPTLTPGQSAVSTFIVRHDRGRFVRSPEELSKLLAAYAPTFEVRHDTLRIPFARIFSEMSV